METKIIQKGPIYAAMRRGLGWEDICVLYKIKDTRKKARVRSYVMSQGKQPAPYFERNEWRKVSGYA